MDIQQLVDGTRDALTVSRVFGEPIDRDGLTVVPVARVRGGAGGGDGDGPGGRGTGGGGGLIAEPVGVYVLRGQEVRWVPAVDFSRIALRGQIVALVALLTVRALARRWRRGSTSA